MRTIRLKKSKKLFNYFKYLEIFHKFQIQDDDKKEFIWSIFCIRQNVNKRKKNPDIKIQNKKLMAK